MLSTSFIGFGNKLEHSLLNKLNLTLNYFNINCNLEKQCCIIGVTYVLHDIANMYVTYLKKKLNKRDNIILTIFHSTDSSDMKHS